MAELARIIEDYMVRNTAIAGIAKIAIYQILDIALEIDFDLDNLQTGCTGGTVAIIAVVENISCSVNPTKGSLLLSCCRMANLTFSSFDTTCLFVSFVCQNYKLC